MSNLFDVVDGLVQLGGSNVPKEKAQKGTIGSGLAYDAFDGGSKQGESDGTAPTLFLLDATLQTIFASRQQKPSPSKPSSIVDPVSNQDLTNKSSSIASPRWSRTTAAEDTSLPLVLPKPKHQDDSATESPSETASAAPSHLLRRVYAHSVSFSELQGDSGSKKEVPPELYIDPDLTGKSVIRDVTDEIDEIPILESKVLGTTISLVYMKLERI
jgi:hypothetical protein